VVGHWWVRGLAEVAPWEGQLGNLLLRLESGFDLTWDGLRATNTITAMLATHAAIKTKEWPIPASSHCCK
jgi:hypothetical protein